MRDGPLLRALKSVVRSGWVVEHRARRLVKRPRWELSGACQGCGSCCERPSLRVSRAVWFLPWTRAAFLAWQRGVNGFELVDTERDSRTFVFRCQHFDTETRRCDSYDSRPFVCRDYPVVLLDQPWPELFEGCGFKLRDRLGGGMARALDDADLTAGQRRELKKRLRLD